MDDLERQWLHFVTDLLRRRGSDTAGKLFRWDRFYYYPG